MEKNHNFVKARFLNKEDVFGHTKLGRCEMNASRLLTLSNEDPPAYK